MGRPRKAHDTITIEIQASPKLVEYLDELVRAEGFGSTRPAVMLHFVWNEVNKLIVDNRLKPR